MNPRSDSESSCEESEARLKGDSSSRKLAQFNACYPAARPTARSYLPEITHQILLDTSDSESDRVGPTRAQPEKDCSERSNYSSSSCELRFQRQAVSRSEVGLVRSHSNPSSGGGTGNTLKLVPSPHPNLNVRSGSVSSNGADVSPSWTNPRSERDVEAVSIAESTRSRFTPKTSSGVSARHPLNPRDFEGTGSHGRMSCGPGTSNWRDVEPGCSSHFRTHGGTGPANDIDTSHHEDLGRNQRGASSSESSMGRFLKGRTAYGFSSPSSSGNASVPHSGLSCAEGLPRPSSSSSELEISHRIPPSAPARPENPTTRSSHILSNNANSANWSNFPPNAVSYCPRIEHPSKSTPGVNPVITLRTGLTEDIDRRLHDDLRKPRGTSSSESSMGRFLKGRTGRPDYRFSSPSSDLDSHRNPLSTPAGPENPTRPSHTLSNEANSANWSNFPANAVSYRSTVDHPSKSTQGVNPVISQRSRHELDVSSSTHFHPLNLGIRNFAPQPCPEPEHVSGRSEPSNLRHQSASHTSANRQTSTSSVRQSNQSYLLGNDSSHKDSSDSPQISPSNRMDVDSSSNQQEINSSDSAIVIMSLVYKKNKIAASSYNSSTGQVQLLESISENSEFRTAVLALRSATPSIVVVPSSGATRFVKDLKTKLEGDPNVGECQFQCLPPRYFAYSFARRTILESSLWDGGLSRSEDAKTNAIVSNINLNDERLVCAFGGLLYHLSTGSPELGVSPSPIASVQHMMLTDKLWIDTESFRNLQIFDPVEHPSSFKWSTANSDDGKSIFSLFERFCSSVGMSKLKAFLANPVNCRRTIEERHEVINFYLNRTNYNAVEALRNFVSQMSSSSVVMNYLSSPTLRGGHWKHIYRHIYYTVSYAEVCRSHGAQSELFRQLGSTIVDAVYSMAHNLERVVDLVNMENNETFVIKYGFHPPLDAAKEKFSRLKIAMDKVTPYEFDSVPAFVTRIQMMYIPEMKFLLSIPHWAPDLSKDDLQLPTLEFKFTANKTAFYKSRRCYELDELLGDAQTDIINEESMIIQSLRNYLKKHMHHIVGMSQKIAEIECIFALAKVAREERYSKPDIGDVPVIDIRGGWHPLLDVPTSQIITNDTFSSSDTSLMKLIYGPNASGKSIYLKQVGLIMYLVHVGSFVPATSAKVGLFSRILARTTKEESVISMSSTMLSELKKLQDSVVDCSKNSLIILDEVGKGSSEMNCIAIVTSALNYFLSHGSDGPHVLLSTHLSGISDFVTSPPHSEEGRNLFELLSMDYTVTEGEIVFLYRIRRGRPDCGFVFEALQNSEFAAPILKTARSVLEALRTGENFLPYCETRIQRSHKYLNFVRKFVNIDMTKSGYLEKLQNKIQRYYDKPSS